MDKGKLSLSVIDCQSGDGELLRKILADAGHNVTLSQFPLITRLTEYDLIILAVKKNLNEKNGFRDELDLLPPEEKMRTVIFGPLTDVETFLKMLESGFFCFISTPCGRNSLVHRIEDYARMIRREGGREEVSLKFFFQGKGYDLLLPGSGIFSALISTMENSLSQNRMLVSVLKDKAVVTKNICEETGIENETNLSRQERELEKEMYQALEKKQFRLYYQPIMSVERECLSGFESLIRWEHPGKGLISPDSFIPVAEKSPFIIPLGYWIIEEAVKQISQWHARFSLDPHLRVSINLSARQFLQANLSDFILDMAMKYNIQSQYLGLEITESAFMEDMKAANITLLTLKSLNFPLYLDDFGTGYSSLTYLLHFPVDVIKIDKSFVEWMHIDEQSYQIVKSVIDLARNMGKHVVAEGIESDEHYQLIKEFGCNYGQGYYFGKPMKASDAESYIAAFCK